nr:atherin-like [Aegilops tauschii subsp. strangulata]
MSMPRRTCLRRRPQPIRRCHVTPSLFPATAAHRAQIRPATGPNRAAPIRAATRAPCRLRRRSPLPRRPPSPPAIAADAPRRLLHAAACAERRRVAAPPLHRPAPFAPPRHRARRLRRPCTLPAAPQLARPPQLHRPGPELSSSAVTSRSRSLLRPLPPSSPAASSRRPASSTPTPASFSGDRRRACKP